MTTSQEQAFNILTTFPDGLTSFELADLMEGHANKKSASARLSQFVAEGVARKGGYRTNPVTGLDGRIYLPTGLAWADRKKEVRDPARKRRRPTDGELVELRRWKANVIKQFPELGVDPIILAARNQVAAILRSEGNETKAALVQRGELDDGETMRIVLSVLRRKEAA